MNIIFFTKYPTGKNLRDGYYQRVQAIDNLFLDCNRFYINYNFDKKFKFLPAVVKLKEGVFEMRLHAKNPIHILAVIILVCIVGRIYLHSILRLRSRFNRFLFLLSRRRILDIHGSVPEEFKIQGDLINCRKFNKIEEFALRHSDLIIGVTNRMINHVLKKHNIKNKKNTIVLPILPNKSILKNKIEKKEINTVIYCGGLQKWQQIEKMLEFVNRHKSNLKFTFLVPEPQKLLDMYKEIYKEEFPGIVVSSPANKVNEWYAKNSFGLILREDTIVNNVACPTKLIEYFQNDVLPIVDSEKIGDFKEMGYKYVCYDKDLPKDIAWKKMILDNRDVYAKIYDKFNNSLEKIKNNI